MHLYQLWRWNGQIARLPYLFWGILLMAFKFNVDRAVSGFIFGISWNPLRYFVPSLNGETLASLWQSQQLTFFFTMVALALPFIAAGVGLTLQRLRSASLPLGLVLLFFVPLINLLFFMLLCLWSERESTSETAALPFWERWLPHSRVGSALAGASVSLVMGMAWVALAVVGLAEYGLILFVGTPFAMGLVASLIFATREHRSLKASLGVACLSVLLLGLGLVLFAFEGVLCAVMAAPLGLGLAALGGLVGWLIQSRQRPQAGASIAMMLLLPALMGFEKANAPIPPLIAVRTSLEVNAPPERVWQHVIAFSELPPPQDWLLKTGIAYPLRAEIRGTGVGAVRHCVFSTGPFVEPITVWDPPRLLKFNVSSQPPPMRELTPYPISPPHLDHFLQSKGGQFLLTPLPGGRTRLEGTTWYAHQIWPNHYWQIWSDLIIHRIHLRVLQHVARLSEETRP
ncbi:MAG: SRPBCC family protein [Candidatus Sericytochromatia bacterium]